MVRLLSLVLSNIIYLFFTVSETCSIIFYGCMLYTDSMNIIYSDSKVSYIVFPVQRGIMEEVVNTGEK